MDRPARLPSDCPRCENRGHINLDDDAILPCPLCNSWCMLCLADVPTFVKVTRPYRGNLIAVLQNMHGFEIELTHAVLEWVFARMCAHKRSMKWKGELT